jgi:hypothetical protein
MNQAPALSGAVSLELFIALDFDRPSAHEGPRSVVVTVGLACPPFVFFGELGRFPVKSLEKPFAHRVNFHTPVASLLEYRKAMMSCDQAVELPTRNIYVGGEFRERQNVFGHGDTSGFEDPYSTACVSSGVHVSSGVQFAVTVRLCVRHPLTRWARKGARSPDLSLIKSRPRVRPPMIDGHEIRITPPTLVHRSLVLALDSPSLSVSPYVISVVQSCKNCFEEKWSCDLEFRRA